MLIIPVIDLSKGLVVHAKQGLRNTYEPVSSTLSTSPEPRNVLSSYLELYPFKTIYIADIDAIQNTGSNEKLILELATEYKQCEFWLDAGIEILNKKISSLPDNIKLILGSENKLIEHEFIELMNERPDLILSLDFNDQGLIENQYLMDNPSIWPQQLIVMSLPQVGSNRGVDKECLSTILNVAENKAVYAAGGVRNIDDLTQLKSMGAKGVLLATALHNGTITKEDLEDFLRN